MPSSDHIGWPATWRLLANPGAIAFKAVMVVFSATSVALVGWIAAHVWRTGDIAESMFFALLGAPILTAFWHLYESTFQLHKRGSDALAITTTESGTRGLKIPYSLRRHHGKMALAAYYAIVLVAATVALIRAGEPAIAPIISGMFAFLAALYFVLKYTGKLPNGHVLVTPDSVIHFDSSFRTVLPWIESADEESGITRIGALSGTGATISLGAVEFHSFERVQVNRLWRLRQYPVMTDQTKRPVSPTIFIPGENLDANPALVLSILLFYARNPGARDELGTEAALQRARSANFGSATGSWEWWGGILGMSAREAEQHIRQRRHSS
ncbi:hypothetical protein H0B56_21135 [Haloechinothrix sp. YIM 98757]|uniref:Uncharacterized protein n=1 Tax=Haloechinothrix aidingensis TaxID=2752311 RepID=A0A838AG00_9PSEU|nr:hypothetical protein [Haloechinothrix aidingensis]MBA0128057.1 hypothetical protein [Haloechinothrix aidingensis]